MLLLIMTQNSTQTAHSTHNAAGVADPCQVRGDVLPNANAALADALSGCQLHKEERNSDNQQKKNIQQHEGPWRKRRRHMGRIQAILFFPIFCICNASLPSLEDSLILVRCSPPPFWWQRYGNLHTLPRPTLNPT